MTMGIGNVWDPAGDILGGLAPTAAPVWASTFATRGIRVSSDASAAGGLAVRRAGGPGDGFFTQIGDVVGAAIDVVTTPHLAPVARAVLGETGFGIARQVAPLLFGGIGAKVGVSVAQKSAATLAPRISGALGLAGRGQPQIRAGLAVLGGATGAAAGFQRGQNYAIEQRANAPMRVFEQTGGGGSVHPGQNIDVFRQGEHIPGPFITKEWVNPVTGLRGAMDSTGKMYAERKDGSVKAYRPAKHIVVTRNPRLKNFIRAEERLHKIGKRLKKVLK